MNISKIFFTLCFAILCYAQSPCPGYGLRFTGTEGFQNVGDWHRLQDFTVEYWIRVSQDSTEPEGVVTAFNILGPTSCDISGWGFFRLNGTLNFIIGGTHICNQNSLSMPLSLNQWTHVAAVVSTSNAILYKNGVQVDSSNKNTSIAYTNDVVPLRVGQGPDDSSWLTNAEMDEVRFWGNARSSFLVQSAHKESFNNDDMPDGLLGYWRFEKGTDFTVVDESGFNRPTISVGLMSYNSNCLVDYCLCDGVEYCVPGVDKLNVCTSSNPTTEEEEEPTTEEEEEPTTEEEEEPTTEEEEEPTTEEDQEPVSTSPSIIMSCMLLLAILMM